MIWTEQWTCFIISPERGPPGIPKYGVFFAVCGTKNIRPMFLSSGRWNSFLLQFSKPGSIKLKFKNIREWRLRNTNTTFTPLSFSHAWCSAQYRTIPLKVHMCVSSQEWKVLFCVHIYHYLYYNHPLSRQHFRRLLVSDSVIFVITFYSLEKYLRPPFLFICIRFNMFSCTP